MIHSQAGGKPPAFAYSRVSTREQRLSLTSQEHAIISYCNYKGLELRNIFSDVGVSGGIPLEQRPRGNALLATLHPGSHFVTHKLDRAWRNAADCLNVCKDLQQRGVTIHIVDMGIDLSGAFGQCFLTMAAAFAELERNLISQRTKEGLAATNNPVGQASFGYNHDRTPNQNELDTLDMIFSLLDRGLSCREVADLLNDSGSTTRSGKSWDRARVKWISRPAARSKRRAQNTCHLPNTP